MSYQQEGFVQSVLNTERNRANPEIATWLRCPLCGSKTRSKIRQDTILMNYPLFCPKCRQETLVKVFKLNISVITEPVV